MEQSRQIALFRVTKYIIQLIGQINTLNRSTLAMKGFSGKIIPQHPGIWLSIDTALVLFKHYIYHKMSSKTIHTFGSISWNSVWFLSAFSFSYFLGFPTFAT
jgi:hypothetical protein